MHHCISDIIMVYILCHIIIHTVSHHHTCHVTSSYILCRMIMIEYASLYIRYGKTRTQCTVRHHKQQAAQRVQDKQRLKRLPYMYALHLSGTARRTAPYTSAFSVCLIRYGCLICMPYMYTLYVCLIPKRRSASGKQHTITHKNQGES